MSHCALELDVDDVARALRGEPAREGRTLTAEHLATCASCRVERALLEEVHTTWREALEEDERSRAVFREQRLAHGVRSRGAHLAWWGQAVLASVVVVSMVAARPWRLFVRAPEEKAVSAGREAPARPLPAPSSSPPSAEEGMIVLASTGEVEPPVRVGEPLARKVHLAARARLTLAWSFALNDETEISGPAELAIAGEGSSMWLLVSGHPLVRSRGDFEVRTAEAITHGPIEHGEGTWQIDAEGGSTHVRSLSGSVAVRSANDGHASDERILREGEELTLPEPRGEAEASSPTTAPADGMDPAKEFARALASLAAGDRVAARRSFRVVADSRRAPASLQDRAVFRWAELELARGESGRARAELAALVRRADLGLAADAAFLLTRSASTPADRAEIWAGYLARRPGTPYREEAMLERAAALIASGQDDTAADVLASLSTEGTLTKVQEERAEALERKLRR